jgi:hypothetical protein
MTKCKGNRRVAVREEEGTKMKNPSKNHKRKCHLCGSVYESTYGVPFDRVWICGDCLSTIPLEQLPRIIGRKKDEVSSHGFND